MSSEQKAVFTKENLDSYLKALAKEYITKYKEKAFFPFSS